MKAWRRTGQRIVLTNGCFDVLHVGHVKFLRKAWTLGTKLIVLLNSDESVRALKGPTRPINHEADRAIVLAELECVDVVVIFHDKRITKWLRRIRPALWIKGGGYTLSSLDRAEVRAAKAVGAAYAVSKMFGGLSTTKILAAVAQR